MDTQDTITSLETPETPETPETTGTTGTPSAADHRELLPTLSIEAWSPAAFQDLVHGRLAQAENRRELARELQRAIVADDPHDAFACAAAAFALGRYHHAYRLLADQKQGPAVSYLRGLALNRLDRGEDALGDLETALSATPERTELQIAQVEALVQTQQIEQAEARLAAFEKAHPGAEAACLRGYLQERCGQVETAIDTYRSVLETDARHPDALFRLGALLDRCGDDDAAIQAYEQLREDEPLYPNAISNLGVLYEDREEYDKAIRCFKWLLGIDPYDARAKLYLKDAEASIDMYYDEEQERLEDKFNQILRTPITDFELSVRSRNCLAKMQIETLGDLVQKTEPELLSYKNFGETSLAEIKDILTSKGLHLGMSLGRDEDARQAREKAISIIFGLQKKTPPRVGTTAPIGAGPVEGDPETFAKPVSEFAFSMRIRRALATLNVNTLGDLAAKTEADFLTIKNFGQTSLEELKSKAAEQGITLRKS